MCVEIKRSAAKVSWHVVVCGQVVETADTKWEAKEKAKPYEQLAREYRLGDDNPFAETH